MTDPVAVQAIFDTLSVDTVRILAAEEILALKHLVASYSNLLPNVSDEKNHEVHKAIKPIREMLENSFAALSMWRKSHDSLEDMMNPMGRAIFSKTIELLGVMTSLSIFEHQTMTDGSNSQIRSLMTSVWEPSGSMKGSNRLTEEFTMFRPEIDIPAGEVVPESGNAALLETIDRLLREGKAFIPGLNPAPASGRILPYDLSGRVDRDTFLTGLQKMLSGDGYPESGDEPKAEEQSFIVIITDGELPEGKN